jgi:hypothetical protein
MHISTVFGNLCNIRQITASKKPANRAERQKKLVVEHKGRGMRATSFLVVCCFLLAV